MGIPVFLVTSELLPKEKVRVLDRLQLKVTSEGVSESVVMVNEGLNVDDVEMEMVELSETESVALIPVWEKDGVGVEAVAELRKSDLGGGGTGPFSWVWERRPDDLTDELIEAVVLSVADADWVSVCADLLLERRRIRPRADEETETERVELAALVEAEPEKEMAESEKVAVRVCEVEDDDAFLRCLRYNAVDAVSETEGWETDNDVDGDGVAVRDRPKCRYFDRLREPVSEFV